MNTTPQRKPRVVIVGGGFGGVRVARELSVHTNLDITLISAENNFSYYPKLYQAATGGSRSQSSIPLAQLLQGHGIAVVCDTITTFDPEQKTISSASGQDYSYDYLVLALGNITNYFGIQGLQEFSYDIKTIAGAERFKRRLHQQLDDDRKPDLNYVVVGGGPTGVELAAALGTYLRRITKLHELDHLEYQIKLVEAAPRILPRMPESMSARVQRRLENLGIEVMTGAVVQGETASALQLEGQSITTKTVVWTAGMSNSPFYKTNAALFTLAKNGKVEVNDHLQSHPGVYVIGDNAATQHSGLAETAINDANYAAHDIVHAVNGHYRPAYHQKAPTSVIPVGENWAAVQWGPVLMYGFIGGVLRHLADLIGYLDIQSPLAAVKVWLHDFRREDQCSVCGPEEAAKVKVKA